MGSDIGVLWRWNFSFCDLVLADLVFLGKGKSGIQEKSDLEIEPIPTKKIPAREHPCKILIHNKSLTQNADELKVELVSSYG